MLIYYVTYDIIISRYQKIQNMAWKIKIANAKKLKNKLRRRNLKL